MAAQFLGGKQTVWHAIQEWVVTTYGSKEAMDSAGCAAHRLCCPLPTRFHCIAQHAGSAP